MEWESEEDRANRAIKPYAPSPRDNRPSVYWTDHRPMQPGPDGRTSIIASPRVHHLSKHKKVHPKHKFPRPD